MFIRFSKKWRWVSYQKKTCRLTAYLYLSFNLSRPSLLVLSQISSRTLIEVCANLLQIPQLFPSESPSFHLLICSCPQGSRYFDEDLHLSFCSSRSNSSVSSSQFSRTPAAVSLSSLTQSPRDQKDFLLHPSFLHPILLSLPHTEASKAWTIRDTRDLRIPNFKVIAIKTAWDCHKTDTLTGKIKDILLD